MRTYPDDVRFLSATGRSRRPNYLDRLPPCNHTCPAGENVQAWLAEAQAGRYEAAWRILVRDNPLPAVHGRVCYHPCEDACSRALVDEAVSIHTVERFLGDRALAERWPVQPERAPSGRRVLVVGAGPSGLSAAWHLAHLGHHVVVNDASALPGGMMHFGIPRYRLPRHILEQEVARIVELGVQMHLEHPVEDLLAEKEAGRFDAVFLAIGAHLSKRRDIPACDAARIYDALQFLRQSEAGEPPRLGRRVAVYGGGNTAMDAARTARRLGAEPLIIYRRTRAQMPAHGFEADEAIEEGVQMHWLRTVREVSGTTLIVEVMELDQAGYPRPTGTIEALEADALVLALGQEPDSAFLRRVPGIELSADGSVVVGSDLQTGCPGIFAGGDMVPFERSVTTAVGHGKRAARAIDAWLRDSTCQAAVEQPLASFDMLRPWYHALTAASVQPRLDLARRRESFDEVVGGLDGDAARREAARCLSCGNCFECDGCYAACPEGAVIKLGPGRRYRYDLDRCTGCGICADQCPAGAIAMIPEPAVAG